MSMLLHDYPLWEEAAVSCDAFAGTCRTQRSHAPLLAFSNLLMEQLQIYGIFRSQQDTLRHFIMVIQQTAFRALYHVVFFTIIETSNRAVLWS